MPRHCKRRVVVAVSGEGVRTHHRVTALILTSHVAISVLQLPRQELSGSVLAQVLQ